MPTSSTYLRRVVKAELPRLSCKHVSVAHTTLSKSLSIRSLSTPHHTSVHRFHACFIQNNFLNSRLHIKRLFFFWQCLSRTPHTTSNTSNTSVCMVSKTSQYYNKKYATFTTPAPTQVAPPCKRHPIFNSERTVSLVCKQGVTPRLQRRCQQDCA